MFSVLGPPRSPFHIHCQHLHSLCGDKNEGMPNFYSRIYFMSEVKDTLSSNSGDQPAKSPAYFLGPRTPHWEVTGPTQPEMGLSDRF